MTAPLVSIIMPLYNEEVYLASAIASVLKQTYGNFEFIIINDGSTDQSPSILRSFKDPRIKLIHLESNKGIVEALNAGILCAQGEYIVRMDADDIIHPLKLSKQVTFLEENKDVDILGTGMYIFRKEDTGRISTSIYQVVDAWQIPIKLWFTTPLAHPTIMFRKEVFDTLTYKKDCPLAEDYLLMIEAFPLFKGSNLPEPLYYYRIHPQNNSARREKQKNGILEAQRRLLGEQFPKMDSDSHYSLSSGLPSSSTPKRIFRWALLFLGKKKEGMPRKHSLFLKRYVFLLLCRYGIKTGVWSPAYWLYSLFYFFSIKGLLVQNQYAIKSLRIQKEVESFLRKNNYS